MAIRCVNCGKLATTRYPCKACGSDSHLAHCHCDDESHDTCTHDWSSPDWPHRHGYESGEHRHDSGTVPGSHGTIEP